MGKIRWIMEREEEGMFHMKTVCGFLELNLFWGEEAGGWYNLCPIIDGEVLSWQATIRWWSFFHFDDFASVINEMERRLGKAEFEYRGKDHITHIKWDDDIVFDLEETDKVARITAQIYGDKEVFEFFKSENGITKATKNGRELRFDINELDA